MIPSPPSRTGSIQVHLLPALWQPEQLTGGIAIVIDVLRASTTILHALGAGARRVLACGEVDQARQLAANAKPGTTLLGGERGGERIPGFDLGNSPASYTTALVAGKQIVLTTTNGTRVMQRCLPAEEIWIGAFANQLAVLEQLQSEQRPVYLICAGSEGRISADDALFAGAIVHGWLEQRFDPQSQDSFPLDDQTRLALALWRESGGTPERILRILRDSAGGQTLLPLGHGADIERAAQCDLFPFVPLCHGRDDLLVIENAH